MRKIILMVAFAVVSSSAMAEWVNLGGNGKEVLYVDTDTIRKQGDIVTLWIMYDFETPQEKHGLRWRSVKMQYENNCKEVLQRPLSTSAHSERMGKGDTVFYNPIAQQWVSVAPSSIGMNIWKYACSEK